MATFSQWLAGNKKHPEPRQITWLCGPETVLIDEVLAYIIGYLGPDPWNLHVLSVETQSSREIWSSLDSHPLGSSPRVVVIRNADQIQQWTRFILWAKNRSRNPRTYVVLVSGEDAVPRMELTEEQRRNREKPSPAAHIAAIGSRGHVIECKPFTTATALKSLEWVQSKVKMRDTVARHLLRRANWDLRLVRDTCLKLSVFPDDISIQVVNALLEERPRDEFEDALLTLDRKTALRALESISPDDMGRIIGLLDYRLSQASRVYDMMSAHRTPGEMAKALGEQAFLLPHLLKVAKHYDSKRRLSVRHILADADAAYRGGQTVGVLEAVVAFW